MKKQIIIGTAIMATLAAYTLYNTEALTTERETFLASCEAKNGIYAEGVLTKKKWKAENEKAVDGKGTYRLEFAKHELAKPTVATLPGIRTALDAARPRLDRGKSYSVCMKKDYELIDYYKSF